RPQVPLRPM
nr:Chain C, Protein Nef [Human immunodeficiency virus 1]4U1K_F Chain F, Protein Nef [Human immunodeficiency virus 1]4U1L_C Chain C, Protein Nef [Human immunodeficiency virus 1]4U1L_F Chain F, Protein Nef [Human immunodeficiency virus 1]4U1M_C Chain C, Protein Nef [Human immunodeficiency virus 1]4U1N_C Chain C, Protein Nef [Human immunodeficiency virus 1]